MRIYPVAIIQTTPLTDRSPWVGIHMAKWREESGKTIKGAEEDSPAEPEEAPAAKPEPRTEPEAGPKTTAPALRGRGGGRRAREGNALRTGVRRASNVAANLVGIVAMIICVLLALHIAFVVFSANDD